MPLPVTVTLVVLALTLVGVLLGYLIHRNAERHDAEGGR
jgi:VIT1/CCC1 family predicted Fe2+/Mn2+ transporter